MSGYTLSARALTDLRKIREYIEQDNAEAALRWIDHIQRQCQLVGEMPGLGRAKPELGARVRVWPVRDYLIFYRPSRRGVWILRVTHARRDFRRVIGGM